MLHALRVVAAVAAAAICCAIPAAAVPGTIAAARPIAGEIAAAHPVRGTIRARPVAGAVPAAHPVSGAPQSAWGYAETAAPFYVAEFPRPLVVRLAGRRDPNVAVRFWCASRGCTFPPADVGDTVNRKDDRTFEVKVIRMEASLKVTLQVPSPGEFVIFAAPVVNDRVRLVRAARFVLTVR